MFAGSLGGAAKTAARRVFTEGLPGVGSGQDGSPILLLQPYHELGLLGPVRGGWPMCESAQASSWRALKCGCSSGKICGRGLGKVQVPALNLI